MFEEACTTLTLKNQRKIMCVTCTSKFKLIVNRSVTLHRAILIKCFYLIINIWDQAKKTKANLIFGLNNKSRHRQEPRVSLTFTQADKNVNIG